MSCFDNGCAGCDECVDDDADDDLCPECHGTGTDKWNDHVLPCPACRATDGVLVMGQHTNGDHTPMDSGTPSTPVDGEQR